MTGGVKHRGCYFRKGGLESFLCRGGVWGPVIEGSDSYGCLWKEMEEAQHTFTSLHCFSFIIQTIFVFVNVLLL